MEPECWCGHYLDEHQSDPPYMFLPCNVEGCDCEDYDEIEEGE